ncbi:MAG: hypothetical protein RMJ07_00230 [Nitrososphaerota archaeon]|nr:hypothetical protein [Candidatus Bathyarchaeota archaeon]MDW8048100.1 hypothetical protein [Nitrososphaerota archaeon]
MNKMLPTLSRLTLASFIFITFLSQFFHCSPANQNTEYPSIRIGRVIIVENGGALIVKDIFTLSTNPNQDIAQISNFQYGFSSVYARNLLQAFSNDTKGKLGLDVIVGDEYFWLRISFSKPIDVSRGGAYSFTVTSIFKDLIIYNQSWYSLNISLYPILQTEAASCSLTVLLPSETSILYAPESFTIAEDDEHKILSREITPLSALTDESLYLEFTSTRYKLLDIDELRRTVTVDPLGKLTVTDIYRIFNRGADFSSISFTIPKNATSIYAEDIYGAIPQSKISQKDSEEYIEVDIRLTETLEKDRVLKILISYQLPSDLYISRLGWQEYVLNVTMIRPAEWIIDRFSVTVLLPEGAQYLNSTISPMGPIKLRQWSFIPEIEFAAENVTISFERFFRISYAYSIFWASFRPTLWTGVAAIFACLLFGLYRVSHTIATVKVSISKESLRGFVETYEEKIRLRAELESLERQSEKGKISRRKYRLQRSSYDEQLSKVQRDLSRLRREVEMAGGPFVEGLKRIDRAEAEIEAMNKNIENVEKQFMRGEISSEERRKLVSEYMRIRERAEQAIEDVLLRFREMMA